MIDRAWIESPIHHVEIWCEHLAQPVLAGRLNYEVAARHGFFEWSVEARNQGLNLSPLLLPLGAGVWSSQAANIPLDYEGLPGLLNDALPDGWGRYLMDKALAREQIEPRHISPAARLVYLADRAWGALTFRPRFDRDPDASFPLEVLGSEMEASIEGDLDAVSTELLKAGSSPQGARPKVMVDLDEAMTRARVSAGAPPQGYSSWLIKFAGRDEPVDAPILEQAYMECAWEAGIAVMESRLLHINGKAAFATRRYDRADQRRHFCHTLGGMIHRSHRNGGLDYAHVAQVMRSLQVPAEDYLEAYSRAVFNAVMSVRDDHAKNVAFMLDENQRWVLSPAYDLTYMEGPGGYHTMTFAGGTEQDPSRADLLRLAPMHGVAEEVAEAVISRMLPLPSRFEAIAAGYGARKAVIAQIGKRLRTIGRGLT